MNRLRRPIVWIPLILILFVIVAVALVVPRNSMLIHGSSGATSSGSGITAPGQQAAAPKDNHGHEGGSENDIEMSPDRVEAAKIGLAPGEPGILQRRLSVPATVVADRNRTGRVAARVVGTVAELKKRLGDTVARGEVIAVLESREVADGKSEYIGAIVNHALQKTLFEREQTLWEKQVSAEQRILKARTTLAEAQLRVDLARQKLSALGLTEEEIATLAAAGQGQTGLQRYEIRAPISGRIVEQFVDLGTPVGGEGQAKELYAIADLSSVWVEVTVSTSDLAEVRDGQSVVISNSASNKRSEGRLIFTSPLLNQETRSARVIAAVDNTDLTWRPGSFVTAEIAVEEQPVGLKLPLSALQTVGGEPVVFVRTQGGFSKRNVKLGKQDERGVEIVGGLKPGETVAVSNSFLLKAELGKSEAGHSH